MGIRATLAVALAFLAACGGEEPKPAGGAPAAPDAAKFARTTFATHTRVPIQAGQNVVWCATFQLAWDALADAVGGGTLALGPPAPAAEVAELNRRTFPHTDLAPASCVAIGGLVRDGVLDRIRAEMTAKFPSERPPAIAAARNDAVGFAFLAKNLAFALPFADLEQPIRFAGGTKFVRAFGIEQHSNGEDAQRVAAQVTWHYPRGGPWTPVAEMAVAGGEDRLLLVLGPAPETLEAGWERAAEVLAHGEAQVLEPHENEFAVPRIDFDATREFPQFAGAPVTGTTGVVLRGATQRTRFRLDRTGAALTSHAAARLTMGTMSMRFEEPFLLALIQKGATRPYLLLWIGNDDLLVGSAPPPGADTSAFVGTWRHQGEGTGTAVLTVRADRTALLEVNAPPIPPERIEGRIETDGATTYLATTTVNGRPPGHKEAKLTRLLRVGEGLRLLRSGLHGNLPADFFPVR